MASIVGEPPSTINAALRLARPHRDLWNADDDWSGITSSAQRKKLQNRLNQRAYRRRKKEMGTHRTEALSHCSFPNFVVASEIWRTDTAHTFETRTAEQRSFHHDPPDSGYAMTICGLSLLIGQKEISCFTNLLRQAYLDYTLNSPRPSCLPLLLRINVLSAFAENARLLGIDSKGLCQCDLISPFNTCGPPSLVGSHLPLPIPPATLQPTWLQKTIVHHPWIDLLPFPTLRDNMLKHLALGSLDDDEFCFDILEISDNDLSNRPAMIVWGEASNANCWEINEAFLVKWAFLLEDCSDIISATNCWRKYRGERPISCKI